MTQPHAVDNTLGARSQLPSASRFTPGNSVAGLVVLALLAVLLLSFGRNDNFEWGVVARYFTSEAVLQGLVVTLWLTAASMAIGVVLGTVVAVMRMSSNPVLSAVAAGWVWIFRGTPLLVQLIFWYNLSALYPHLALHIPFGPTLFSVDANDVISPMVAALLGLGLSESGYMAEIVRGGILGVDQEQVDAAKALGMRRGPRFLWVIGPQAMRLIIPATGNRTISELKDTALVSVIAMHDLLYTVQIIYSNNYRTIPLLVVAVLWYLIVVTLLTVGQRGLERFVGRGSSVATVA